MATLNPLHRAKSRLILCAAIAACLVTLLGVPSSAVVRRGVDITSVQGGTLLRPLAGSVQSSPLNKELYVATTGSDASAGTLLAPMATVAKALEEAPTGGTVILRAGSYHESVIMPDSKQLTLRSYPGETVWFDGSTIVDEWRPFEDLWIRDNWTAKFDASPTYERGAPDNTAPFWQFLNKEHPMAAHPDQFWIDGVALRQVQARNEVKDGTFYVDYLENRLYSGSNPIGREARASDLNKAIVVAGRDSVLMGFSIRRYAPSVPDMGAVYISPSAAGTVLNDVLITQNATTGLCVNAANVQLTNVTSTENGMLGIQSSESDHLGLKRVTVANNNTEHFNPTPTAGGVKVGTSRHISIAQSTFSHNDGNGLWFDESVFDITVVNSSFTGNREHGLQVELSAKALVANNLFTGNAGSGLEIQNAGGVEVWNNSFSGNLRAIRLLQDAREASNLSTPGHDPRQRLPDPTVNWLVQDITVKNNVLSDAGANSTCLVCLDADRGIPTPGRASIIISANVWHRPSADRPAALLRWDARPADPLAFPDLESFRRAAGTAQSGLELLGPPVVDAEGRQTAELRDASGRVAESIPARVGQLTGLPAGTRRVGAAPRQ